MAKSNVITSIGTSLRRLVSDLLGALAAVAGERVAKSKTWPDSPRALAGRLRRAAAFLRKIGIEISFGREGRARTRMIHITTTGTLPAPETGGAQPSASSAPPAPSPTSNAANDFAAPGLRTVAHHADGAAGGNDSTVRVNPLKANGETDADDITRPNPRRKMLAGGRG
jgi:hypothetical protein